MHAAHLFSIVGIEIVCLRFVGCETDGVKLIVSCVCVCTLGDRRFFGTIRDNSSDENTFVVCCVEVNKQFKRNIF